MPGFCGYTEGKAKKRTGRLPKDKTKGDYLEVRIDAEEKQAFKDVADLAGIGLSTWVRERLRVVARKELEGAGTTVAFMRQ